MATIYSIAERCGVSPATVSRALSRPEMVSAELRERVLRVAAEVDYQVNRNARRLAKGVSGLTAVLVPDITNPYFPPLIRALGSNLETLGTSVLMVDTADDPERERSTIRRLRGEVDGFVLISPRASLKTLQSELRQSRAVLVNRPGRTLNSVVIDESEASRELFGALRAHGHQRVGYLGGSVESWVNGRRRALASTAARAVGIELTDLGAHEASVEQGRQAVEGILRSGVSAVFAFDDSLALGVIGELRNRGAGVPDDYSVAGCDDLNISALTHPALTSIGAGAERVAAEALRLLGESTPGQLQGKQATVPAVCHLRESVGKAR